MPGTDREYLAFAVSEIDLYAFQWSDGSEITVPESRDLLALRSYHRYTQRKRIRGPQRRALALLRGFLSTSQRSQLNTRHSFLVTANSGRTYRLDPRHGYAEEVSLHKTRWFAVRSFCLHDDRSDTSQAMPLADLTLAHLLLLLADEAEFLRTANARSTRDMLWNRDYLRRLRQRRTSVE